MLFDTKSLDQWLFVKELFEDTSVEFSFELTLRVNKIPF